MPSLNIGLNIGNVDIIPLGIYRADAGGNRFPLFGRSIDGNVTLSSGSNNINAGILGTASGGRTIDAPKTAVTGIVKLSPDPGTPDTLQVTSTTNFRAGDICVMVNMRGSSTRFTQVGVWEFVIVDTIDSGTQMTLKSELGKLYGQDGSLVPVNTDLTGQSVVIQRIPEYDIVTLSGTAILTNSTFNGSDGGICAFMCSQLICSGSGKVNSSGYRGGSAGADGEGIKGTTWSASNTGGKVGGAGVAGGGAFPTNGGGGGGASGGGGGGGGGHISAGTGGGVGGGGGSAGGRGQPSPLPPGLTVANSIDGFDASGQSGGGFGGATAYPTGAGGSGPSGGAGGSAGSTLVAPATDVLDIDHVFAGGGGGGSGASAAGAPGATLSSPSGAPFNIVAGQGGSGGSSTGVPGGDGGGITMIFARQATLANVTAVGASGPNGANGTAGTPGFNATTNGSPFGGGWGGGAGAGGSSAGGAGAGGSVVLVANSVTTSSLAKGGGSAGSGGSGAGGTNPGGPATPAVPPSFGASTAGGRGGNGGNATGGSTGGAGRSFIRFIRSGTTPASASADGVGNYSPDTSAYKATL